MDAAFSVVFALFVLAMIGLAFTAVRWAVRRDRAGPGRPRRRPRPGRAPDVDR